MVAASQALWWRVMDWRSRRYATGHLVGMTCRVTGSLGRALRLPHQMRDLPAQV